MFLDLALLVVPLTLMVVAYGRIALTLMHGFRQLNDDHAIRRQCHISYSDPISVSVSVSLSLCPWLS